jgi:hypothetical protein
MLLCLCEETTGTEIYSNKIFNYLYLVQIQVIQGKKLYDRSKEFNRTGLGYFARERRYEEGIHIVSYTSPKRSIH